MCSDKSQRFPGSILVALLQSADCFVLVAESEIDKRKTIGRNISLLGNGLELVTDLYRFVFSSGGCVRITEQPEHGRVLIERTCFLVLFNGTPEIALCLQSCTK